jgi:two-component system, chemotaxis family, protein-glutamate methylesterase/glutaminase
MPISAVRDIIVVGASTGGIDAVKTVLAGLPQTLPAAVFVVIHQGQLPRSYLVDILARGSALSVRAALHAEPIEHGRVYVAPADHHLLLRQGELAVMHGPRENGHRPAVDPLFRSAAETYGARVIGVVLTGALDCGTGGLQTIKARGGIGVAQDPTTAVCSDMPESAIRSGAVDHVVALEDIAPLLVRLNAESTPAVVAEPPPSEHAAALAFVTCPLCNGSLTETHVGSSESFACHVGHRFSLRSLYAEQADQVESAIWAAIRALEESVSLAQRLAGKSSGDLRARFSERERAMAQHAQTLREVVLGSKLIRRTDVIGEAEP